MDVIAFIEKIFDDYTRKARLTPALLVIFPLVLVAISFFQENIWSWGNIIGLLFICGIFSLAAQISRDMGKNIEDGLYKEWGGKPTTSLLRHNLTQNEIQLARYHEKINKLTGEKIPNKSDEISDSESADKTYDTCIKFLIGKTRDTSKFSLIYKENCNYGFRRNLLGMKPYGITISTLSILIIGIRFSTMTELSNILKGCQKDTSIQALVNFNFSKLMGMSGIQKDCQPDYWGQLLMILESSKAITVLGCLGGSILLFIIWLSWVNSNWVKSAAYAYAARLIESCEILP